VIGGSHQTVIALGQSCRDGTLFINATWLQRLKPLLPREDLTLRHANDLCLLSAIEFHLARIDPDRQRRILQESVQVSYDRLARASHMRRDILVAPPFGG